MDRISLAELVATDFFRLACEDESKINRFVEIFGHYMDITPENLYVFISKIANHIEDVIEYIENMDGFGYLSDDKIRDLARSLNIACCDRCFDPWEILDDIRDHICDLTLQRQAEIITRLFKYMKPLKGIPDATITNTGRFVAIEEVLNLCKLLEPTFFANTFGNACSLNEKTFAKYYRNKWGNNKWLFIRAIVSEAEDTEDVWADFLAHIGIERNHTCLDEIVESRNRLDKMSVSRLSKAAIEIINKKLDQALKERIEKDKKAIDRQLKKDMRSK